MNAVYVYPGSFCPPTYGHLAVLHKAAAILSEVVVICSRDDTKHGYWFSPEECAELWRSYELPVNTRVTTLFGFLSEKVPGREVVMIRGVRGEADLEHEASVMSLNKELFGIDKYLYLLADEEMKSISSSCARKAADQLDFETLALLVSPGIAGKLLEKALGIRNLVMVVGQPGSGKSIFLSRLCREDRSCTHINTDDFNKLLRPVLHSAFPGRDLVEMALNEPDALKKVIARPWFELLKGSLKEAIGKSHVFVEVAYGLEPGMDLYRYLGGKVLAFGCQKEKLLERNKLRGTPMYLPFIEKIPGLDESQKIAKVKRLDLTCLQNSEGEETLPKMIDSFQEQLWRGELWQ